MKKLYLYIALISGVGFTSTSCSDFLDREPITVPNNANFLKGEEQLRSYINSLYPGFTFIETVWYGNKGRRKKQ